MHFCMRRTDRQRQERADSKVINLVAPGCFLKAVSFEMSLEKKHGVSRQVMRVSTFAHLVRKVERGITGKLETNGYVTHRRENSSAAMIQPHAVGSKTARMVLGVVDWPQCLKSLSKLAMDLPCERRG
mmetsp:Transcript_776/g.1937  ORF Transcript_776/g.1937 Transcript_776/m.1937 type:complete len:128 (-) Transcript_776:888-1271(-)